MEVGPSAHTRGSNLADLLPGGDGLSRLHSVFLQMGVLGGHVPVPESNVVPILSGKVRLQDGPIRRRQHRSASGLGDIDAAVLPLLSRDGVNPSSK